MQPFFADYYHLLEIILNDLEKTFNGLPAEAINWVPAPETSSLGVIVVHTLGATRYLIGDVCLGDLSDRDRTAEFTHTGLTESALADRMADTRQYLAGALERFTIADLGSVKTFPGRDTERTVSWALLHALEHASQHVGHAQITRQLWDQQHA